MGRFLFLNTHLDHLGIQARIKGASLLLKLSERIGQFLPKILVGDFNFTREFEAYSILHEKLKDTQFSSLTPPTGGDQTFNDFGSDKNIHNKIDFVFTDSQWDTLTHSILTQTYNSRFPSDHYPIITSLNLK
jgi:endonuclease/exonuclease/phosphatase family metal-dependent hydrolase